jgi:FSR family fosmidomycin resistance protein-like MFS transporter
MKSASERTRLSAVSFLHFYNDLHASFLPTILPEMIRRLSMTIAEAGALNSLFGATHMLVQPLAGRLADRTGRPVFALIGPILTAFGACLIPLSPTYGTAILFVLLFSVGTAAFHPQGHGLAGLLSRPERLSFTLALFGAAGTLGAALSPLYVLLLLGLLGTKGLPLAAIPSLLLLLLWPCLSRAGAGELRQDRNAPRRTAKVGRIGEILRRIGPLLGIATVRDATSQGFRVFLPLWIVQRGGSLNLGGTALFLFTLAGVLATVAGSRIADRVGKMRTLKAMLIPAPLFLLSGTLIPGIPGLTLLIIGGALLSGTSSTTTAMAQEREPGDRSLVSSLVMGLSWGTANLLTLPVGALADRFGLTVTLCGVAFLPWAGTYLFLRGRGADGKTAA